MTRASRASRWTVWMAILWGSVVSSIFCADAHGQSTQPVEAAGSAVTATPPAARGPSEYRPIMRSTSGTAATQPARNVPGTGGDGSSSAGLDVQNVILSLGLVIVLILVLRWTVRRMFPGQIGIRASRAVQVVSRSVLSPKQQFLLLQVGKRLIVVADTGANMNALCQITDADEVAELLGQIRSDASESIGKNFMSLFGRSREKFDASDDVSSGDLNERAELLGNGDDLTAPEVGMTRDEISGLMDKVRLLSRQFKRS